MRATIVGARQEAAGLSKDGKSLVSPVLPRLLARFQREPQGKPASGGARHGHRSRGGDKPAGGAGSRFGGCRPSAKRSSDKENRPVNAVPVPPTPAKPRPGRAARPRSRCRGSPEGSPPR